MPPLTGSATRLALYLVADPDQTSRDLIEVVEVALANGVTTIQLRSKSLTDRATLTLANAIVERCRTAGAMSIINDRLDIALAAGADGIHLGVDDLPIADARRLAPQCVIGYSPETDVQASAAAASGANYLGVGPVFGTVSKADAGAAIGLPTVERRTKLAGAPVIGIGGISASTAKSVIDAGAVGVAVVSAILRAPEPAAATRELSETIRSALANIQ